MTILISLDREPVLRCSLHLPVNGAWSAELQVAAESAPDTGATVELVLHELAFTGRVVRSGTFAERAFVRLTGGEADWSEVLPAKHYRETTVDQVVTDLGLALDIADSTALPFWSRADGTRGAALASLAERLGVRWRVNPDGAVRMRAEDPQDAGLADALELERHPSRGVVTLSPADSNPPLPGSLVGEDELGDVLVTLSADDYRVRYYTAQRGRLRGALEALVRWVTRDAVYLGSYSAEVVAQAADGTLDLLVDDARLRAEGLQAVPIRHGLPGVTVEVAQGERVLLSFDGGDPRQPYAALWHAGQATKIIINSGTTIEAAGTQALALAIETKAQLDALQNAHDTHMHPTAGTGAPSPPTVLVGALGDIATSKLLGA